MNFNYIQQQQQNAQAQQQVQQPQLVSNENINISNHLPPTPKCLNQSIKRKKEYEQQKVSGLNGSLNRSVGQDGERSIMYTPQYSKVGQKSILKEITGKQSQQSGRLLFQDQSWSGGGSNQISQIQQISQISQIQQIQQIQNVGQVAGQNSSQICFQSVNYERLREEVDDLKRQLVDLDLDWRQFLENFQVQFEEGKRENEEKLKGLLRKREREFRESFDLQSKLIVEREEEKIYLTEKLEKLKKELEIWKEEKKQEEIQKQEGEKEKQQLKANLESIGQQLRNEFEKKMELMKKDSEKKNAQLLEALKKAEENLKITKIHFQQLQEEAEDNYKKNLEQVISEKGAILNKEFNLQQEIAEKQNQLNKMLAQEKVMQKQIEEMQSQIEKNSQRDFCQKQIQLFLEHFNSSQSPKTQYSQQLQIIENIVREQIQVIQKLETQQKIQNRQQNSQITQLQNTINQQNQTIQELNTENEQLKDMIDSLSTQFEACLNPNQINQLLQQSNSNINQENP